MTAVSADTTRRLVRHADLGAAQHAWRPFAIDELYDDALDVLSVRAALNAAPLEAATRRLDGNDPAAVWSRPNETMPVEDVHLLGSDAPATPTYSAPRGVSLDDYLASARRHEGAVERVFGDEFPIVAQLEQLLGRFSGGRPVRVARAGNGSSYVPCTLRRMANGRQIGVHHDYHYGLQLYQELGPTLDTRTLISFVITLRKPQAGGELHVYGVTPTTPNAPKMPNGFQWDLPAIEARYDQVQIGYEAGDLFLLASGRCLHRVGRVAGPDPRITLGGFLALDTHHEQVLFWS